MSDETFTNGVSGGPGSLQAGDDFGRGPRKDAARQAKGAAKAALGSAEGLLGDVADKVSARVSQVRVQAKVVADRASDAARAVSTTVDPFVRQRPYAALGVAMGIGLLAGLLLAGRGPKVIYVRPPVS